MRTLAVFRSCLRKEYRDQVIKMLRAVPGEHTRTSYRTDWISPEALELIESGENFNVVTYLVDQNLQLAFPTRIMKKVSHVFDSRLNTIRFTFEIGDYLDESVQQTINLLANAEFLDSIPPKIFVAMHHEELGIIKEINYSASLQSWKNSISFLTYHWPELSNTVFFRPHGNNYGATPSGPTVNAIQSERLKLPFDLFNPHFSDDQLSQRKFQVTIGEVLGELQPIPLISRDGFIDFDVDFFEPGQGTLQIEVRPDPQFSAYVPLTVNVARNQNVDPSPPRVLGPSWNTFLASLRKDLENQKVVYSSILDQLKLVFPEDSELALSRGQLHYDTQEFGAARDEFLKVLNVKKDIRATWWSLFAALRAGDVRDAEQLMDQVDLSREDFYDDAVKLMHHLDDETIRNFAPVPGLALSEDKALRLLLAMVSQISSETTAVVVVKAIAEINAPQALATSRKLLIDHEHWLQLRRRSLDYALQSGRHLAVEEDAELILEWDGGDISQYLSVVQQMRDLANPQRFAIQLLTNARRLIRADNAEASKLDRLNAALTLAVIAADYAASMGDFIYAQEAIQFVDLNELLDGDTYRQIVRPIARRMAKVLQSNPDLELIEECYLQEIVQDLGDIYKGKVLVVFGSQLPDPILEDLRESLGLLEIRSIKEVNGVGPDPKKIKEVVASGGYLIVLWEHADSIDKPTSLWMRDNGIKTAKAIHSKRSLLNALRAMMPTLSAELTYIPESCIEAVDWCRENCLNLRFSEAVDASALDLDRHPGSKLWANIIKNQLQALDRFASGKLNGTINGSFWLWAPLGGISKNDLSLQESETTNINPQLRKLRTFPVDTAADPSGSMYMKAHFRVPSLNGQAPRIHFTTDTLSVIGKIYVGYVGKHLALNSSN